MANGHTHAHRVVIATSLLRLSAWERLAVAAVVVVVIWAAAIWAMS